MAFKPFTIKMPFIKWSAMKKLLPIGEGLKGFKKFTQAALATFKPPHVVRREAIERDTLPRFCKKVNEILSKYKSTSIAEILENSLGNRIELSSDGESAGYLEYADYAKINGFYAFLLRDSVAPNEYIILINEKTRLAEPFSLEKHRQYVKQIEEKLGVSLARKEGIWPLKLHGVKARPMTRAERGKAIARQMIVRHLEEREKGAGRAIREIRESAERRKAEQQKLFLTIMGIGALALLILLMLR